MDCRDLDSYMTRYGTMLAEQAAKAVTPLHRRGIDPAYDSESMRQPYPAQADTMTAGIKLLHESNSLLLKGACGVGKTLVSQLICHGNAAGRHYRGLVFCPPHLCEKWRRELHETIPCRTMIVRTFKDLVGIEQRVKSDLPYWCIVSQNTAKLGPAVVPAFVTHLGNEHYFCPHCGEIITKEATVEGDKLLIPIGADDADKLGERRKFCRDCHQALWQYIRKPDRWPVATYIHKQLKGFFDYLIIDECHQVQGEDSAQANAAGSLVAACKKTIAMTGTMMNGYANSLRTMLLRIAPTTLIDDGFGWSDKMPFNERYGRIERKITTREGNGTRNRYSKGSQRTTKYVRPGVMPSLFGDHLIDKTIFLELEDVSDHLPPLDEKVIAVDMDEQQRAAYDDIETALVSEIKQMIARGDKRLLGAMINVLLGYPDKPYGWKEIGYYASDKESANERVWHSVIQPPDLDYWPQRPKEKALIEAVRREVAEGRQVWVFSTMTDKHDVLQRLKEYLEAYDLRVRILRSGDVDTKEREAWIQKHGPDYDVILSHPELVETGLDLLDKQGSYNFSTLMFYMTGYKLNTLRQASRRHWRLIQKMACRTYYFYYKQSMQDRAMVLMGKKLSAAEALEGKFSSEGLAAMAGDEGSMEMALARSLVEKIDDYGAASHWEKIVIAQGATP